MLSSQRWKPSRRGKFAVGALLSVLFFFVIFDWNWLRGPVQRFITSKTERAFNISALDVDFGLTPTLILHGVDFANADWAEEKGSMAKIEKLSISISLRDVWEGKLLVPRAALTNATLKLEKSKDGKKNWVLKNPDEARESGSIRVGSITVDRGTLHYVDRGEPFEVAIDVETFEESAREKATEADAKQDNRKLASKYVFEGTYHDGAFRGEAITGPVLSFQETGIPFPIKGTLDANTTKLRVDGVIADLANISGIDVNLEIEGNTLASLYPFLLLPLPASPPYAFEGRLIKKDSRYAIDNLTGKIGSTDVRGKGAYVDKEPRPLLTAELQSKLLNIADLGPVIGLDTKASTSAKETTRPRASDTVTRERAKKKAKNEGGDKVLPTGTAAGRGEGILPSGKFEGGRFRAIDADIGYSAARLKAPTALPVEDMGFTFRLHDGVAKLKPLRFGFAGGQILADVTLDARDERALRSELRVDFKGLKISKLVPDSPRFAQGSGTVGARLHLRGTGDSIADAAAVANGEFSAAVSGARVSNLVDAAAGLNGAKVLSLLASGDKEISVHCAAIVFDVKNGLGQSRLIAMDTEQTMVEGTGAFTLRNERFDVRVEAKPKQPGFLSFRTPIHAHGSFRQAEFELEKTPLIARGAAALLLGAVNPFAAVLALIEPGTSEVGDCRQSSTIATAQSKRAAR